MSSVPFDLHLDCFDVARQSSSMPLHVTKYILPETARSAELKSFQADADLKNSSSGLKKKNKYHDCWNSSTFPVYQLRINRSQ